MNRNIYIAIIASAIVHLALITGAFVVVYHHEEDDVIGKLGGGGGSGGIVEVSIVDEVAGGRASRSSLTLSRRGASGAFSAAMEAAEKVTGVKEPPAYSNNSSSSDGGSAGGSGGGSGGGHGDGIGPGQGKGDPRLTRIWQKVNRSKYYPRQAKKKGWEGAPRVRFAIDKSGAVNSVSLIKSCGVPELDQAALETIRRSAPLPYYPQPITLAIRYSMRE